MQSHKVHVTIEVIQEGRTKKDAREAAAQKLRPLYTVVRVEDMRDPATDQQRKALFLYLGWLAKICRDAGISLQTLVQGAELPVTKDNLYTIWQAYAKHITGKKSIKKLQKESFSEVEKHFTKIFLDRGLEIPNFPSEEEAREKVEQDNYYKY